MTAPDGSERGRGTALVLAAAALFSTGGTAIKLCGLPGWQVSGGRSLIAATALLLCVPEARRGWTGRTWLVAVPYALCVTTFALANKLTTSANAIFLQSTAPLYLLLLAPWLLGERPRPRDLAFMAALAAGFSCFWIGTEPARATATDPARGNAIASVSAVFWALTVAGLRSLAREDSGHGAVRATVAGCLLAFAFSLPTAGSWTTGGPRDWGALAFLGLVQVAGAYVCLSAGVRRIPAFAASLLLLFEPVLSMGLAWAVHGEEPGPWSLAGAATILVSTAVYSIAGAR